MGQFEKGIYAVETLDERKVAQKFFGSDEEIFDLVRSKPAGTYRVFRNVRDEHGQWESGLWDYVQNYGDGNVFRRATIPELIAESISEL